MRSNFIPLSQLMKKGRGSEVVVAIDKNKQNITWEGFATDVSRSAQGISSTSSIAYVLACDDLYLFATAFMALCAAEKHIIIAPNLLPKNLQHISKECDATILCDEDILKILQKHEPIFEFKNIDPDLTFFTLYTSGSTGSPSIITKPLSALEAEAQTTHHLWGAAVSGGAFASSVVHYHAYGLLFQFAWPLSAQIPFIIERINYPEILENYKDEALNFISSPAFLSRYSKSPTITETQQNLKFISSAGSPLPKDIASIFRTAIVEIYGSSETGIIATRTPQKDANWSPLPKVEIKTDSKNHILVRSLYTGLDEWCNIHDTIEILEDGRFKLKGRQDRIVKIHEKRVSLDSIEKSCLETGLVQNIKALSLGENKHLGCVAILSAEGNKILSCHGKPALVNHLKAHLRLSFDLVLLPRKWRFIDEFPQNDMGKTLKNDLLELFEKRKDD